MTPDQIALVQRSFAELEASEPGFSRCFYTRLFQLDTSLRVLFQGDSAAQGARLMQMLKLAVGALARTEALAPTLRSLGARHQGYGVRHYDFETLAQALNDSLRNRLGKRFDTALEEAWSLAYTLIANEMRRGMAGGDTEAAAWTPRRAVDVSL